MERSSLDDLRLFLTVARRGSFTRAAADLGMPTSTLSRRLAAMEAGSGCRLLHRTSRRVALTDDGARLLDQTGPLVDALTLAADEVLAGAPQPRGWVRVTAPVVTGAEWVAPALGALATRHPDLRIALRLTNQLVDLVEGRIDLAIRVGPIRLRGAIARRLRIVPYGLFAAPSFIDRRLAGRPTLDVETLRTMPGILATETTTWRLRHGAVSVAMRPHARIVVDDPRVGLALASDGLGVAAAPDEMAARLGRELVRLTIPGHELEARELFLVYLAKEQPSRVRVVADALLRTAAPMRG